MQYKQSSLKDFQIFNKLGQGAFGVVYKVKRREDNKEYALKKVKLITMKQKERENAVNQIRILASLNNDYVIGYKDAFFDQLSSTLCIVMEYASKGDLLKKINNHMKARTKFPQEQIWKAIVHMSRGLKSLHDKKILHRDLKCANVFINDQGVYKLGDLNVSKVLKQGMAYTQTGTPYYASPEVWQDQPYDMKSDIWSLGCVIYQMTTLHPPFQATDLQGLFKKVKAGVFQKIPSCYSNQLSTLISSLIKVSPRLRPSADEILSNNAIMKYYKSGNLSKKDDGFENSDLLQTIKFNANNLRALKDKLPRSNYFKQNEKKQTEITEFSNIISRISQEKNSQKVNLEIKKRERVLSACGRVIINQSPILQRKQINNHYQIPSVKQSDNNNNNIIRLPPKPPGVYKLPPKPQAPYYNHSPNKKAPSNNYSYEDALKLIERNNLNNPDIQYQRYFEQNRQRSKQNLIKVAQKILNNNVSNINKIIRSNSVDRIQPNWWG